MIVEKSFLSAAFASLAAAAVSRSPTLMQNGKLFGLELSLNVGYVVLFGPPVIFLFYVFADRGIRAPAERIDDHSLGWLFAVVVLLPAVIAGFLVVQYLRELRPALQCNNPSAFRALWGSEPFQPTYCVGDDPELQVLMPHLFDPPWIWSLLQVALVPACLWLAVRVLQAARAKLAAQEASSFTQE